MSELIVAVMGVAVTVVMWRFVARLAGVPDLDGLFGGESLVERVRADLSIDDSRPVDGFAYLTDFRVVWVPWMATIGRTFGVRPQPSTAHPDAVMFNLSEIRHVYMQRGIRGSVLTLVTPEGDYKLSSAIGGLKSWQHYLIGHCRNLSPNEEDVIRSPIRAQFNDDFLVKARKASLPGTIVLGVLLLSQVLPLGGTLHLPVLAASALAVVILGLGYWSWWAIHH